MLEEAEEALAARAWMVANASRTLDIQAFIWRLDRAGALLADAIVRAAERGVRVRVLLDGLGPKPPLEFLAALSGHPNLETRIYNPVGTGQLGCLDFGLEFLFRFNELNHRMHNKSFLMDGLAGIVGGRNFADEYFGWALDFNFKDRDAFLVGPVVTEMEESFDGYWTSAQVAPIRETRPASPGPGLMDEGPEGGVGKTSWPGKPARIGEDSLEALQGNFCTTALERLVWTEVRFVADRPEKNLDAAGFPRRGATAKALRQMLGGARERIVIQSPYMVLSPADLAIADELRDGIEVRVSTNSLASTDNVPAFSGYRKQRERFIRRGVEVREFKPYPALRGPPGHVETARRGEPMVTLHAKTAVVDRRVLFIGAFNFDPRGTRWDTEQGVIIEDPALASAVDRRISNEMEPENSWNPAVEDPEQYASLWRRLKLWFYGLFPLKPYL